MFNKLKLLYFFNLLQCEGGRVSWQKVYSFCTFHLNKRGLKSNNKLKLQIYLQEIIYICIYIELKSQCPCQDGEGDNGNKPAEESYDKTKGYIIYFDLFHLPVFEN